MLKKYYLTCLIKKDALEDKLTEKICSFINSHSNIRVISKHPINLNLEDACSIYKPEIDCLDFSSRKLKQINEKRAMLMSLGIASIVGNNILLRVCVAAENFECAIRLLSEIKGKTGIKSDIETIRSKFASEIPQKYIAGSFWIKAPFLVRNRVHTPDSKESLDSMEAIVRSKNIKKDRFHLTKEFNVLKGGEKK